MALRAKVLAIGLAVVGVLCLAPLGEATYAPGCSVRLDLGVGPVHEAWAMALQPDGRIVVAGYVDLLGGSGKDFIVARYHPDLTLDTSFNGVGYVVQDFFLKDDEARAVVIQTDGKILVGGYATDAGGTLRQLALARFLPDGTLDLGFGAITRNLPGNTEELRALALQSNGNIIGVGYQTAVSQELMVTRFSKDGTWDNSFDGDGVLAPSIGDNSIGTGVTIAPNGKIVVSGTAIFAGDANFLALRLHPDGTPDTGFNGSGWVDTDLGFADYANGGLAVDQSNNVIVAGDSNFDIALVRYRPDGTRDMGFGTMGIQTHDVGGNDSGQAVAIHPLGIVVAGYGGPGVNIALTRFDPADGSNNLSVTAAISGLQNEARALVIRDDGKYVIAGYSQLSVNQLTLALFNTDGSQDCSTLTLHPEADAAVAMFDPVGTCSSHADCVNDQVLNPLVGDPEPHDNLTTYVTSPTSPKTDLYKLKDGVMGGAKAVTEIEIFAQVAWGGVLVPPTARLVYQRAGFDAAPVTGTSFFVGHANFAEHVQKWSGLNWDASQLDALEIGLEHVGGNELRLTQIYVTVTLGEPQPRPVDAFTASASGDGAGGQVALNWLNPSYGIYDRTIIRRDTGGCPGDPAAGTAVVVKNDGLGGVGSYVDMLPHGTYYYSAFVADADGHVSKEACLVATTFDRTSGAREWVFSTSEPSPALATPGFRTSPGVAFAVTNEGRVHAMQAGRANTGGGSWPVGWKPFKLGDNAPNRPPIVPVPSGQWAALFGAEDGRVYAIDSTSGDLLWRSARLGPKVSSSPAAILSGFGASKNLVFIGTRNSSQPNQFYALDPDDGTVVWSYDPGPGPNSMGMVTSSPSVDYATERVYFTSFAGGSGRTLWCIDFSGGSPAKCGLWPDFGVAVSTGDVDVSPILFAGYVIVTDTLPGDLYIVNPMDGSALLIGNVGSGGAIGFTFPRLGAGSSDVIVSTSTDVQSVDVSPPGNSNWVFSGVPSPSTPLQVPFTNDIYIGRSDGKVNRLSTLAPGGPGSIECVGNCTSTVVGSSTFDVVYDMIYFGTIDGEIYALKTPF